LALWRTSKRGLIGWVQVVNAVLSHNINALRVILDV
jgi:hypothetical protein